MHVYCFTFAILASAKVLNKIRLHYSLAPKHEIEKKKVSRLNLNS